MSIATLLTEPAGPGQAETFAFEHAMAHRQLLGAMATAVSVFTPQPVPPPAPPPSPFILPGTSGLAGFSALPYGPLDPAADVSLWHLDHGQAHSDAQTTLPGWFELEVQRLNPAQNLVDFNFSLAGQRTWWTFANHQQHLTAQSVLPQQLVLPFW